MSEPFGRLRRFLRELKRRKVYRVAAVYAGVAFVVVQAANLVFPALKIPGWAYSLVVVLALLGFPLAVVLAWAFEVTPKGVRRTPEAEPAETSEAPKSGSRTGYKVLLGLGLIAVAVVGGWYLTGGDGGAEAPEVSEGTVAVLPFEVSGSGADTWREGMVTMLTTGLDGTAGLRAIPDRTVFAAWEEQGQTGEGSSSQEAVALARQVGARYAIVGSAVALGEELRLTANVHSTRSGDRLGQAEVRGSPDSITSLADSLTRHVLGVLVEEGENLPPVNLAGLTTSSLPALKSYLTAERHYRSGEYEQAVEDYKLAIDQDSAFALAYDRLATAGIWVGEGPQTTERWLRAYRLSDRLPRRERRIVWANYARTVLGQDVIVADSLRRWTEVYPDDSRFWFWFGATSMIGGIPAGWTEAESALEQAIELDPGVAHYHADYVMLGMGLNHDSALVAQRLEAHPEGRAKELYRTLWALDFGSPGRRKAAWARLDTMRLPYSPGFHSYWMLLHPTHVGLQERVWETLANRDDTPDAPFSYQVSNWARGGRIDKILSKVPGSYWGWSVGCDLAGGLTLGVPIPDSVLRSQLDPARIEQGSSSETVTRLRCVGLYLAERGREDELKRVLKRLERLRSEAEDRPDIESRASLALRSLQGYQAWKAGELEHALKLWADFNEFGWAGAIWRGDLHRELGNLEKARDWYVGAWPHPVAHERLGQLYEEMGKPEKAAAAYRRFIAAWEDADPELQRRVDSARKRLAELTASGAEQDE